MPNEVNVNDVRVSAAAVKEQNTRSQTSLSQQRAAGRPV